MTRRLLALVLAVVMPLALVGAAVVSKARAKSAPVFASLGAPTLPFVPSQGFLSATWYCAGVPLAAGGKGGAVVVANPTDGPLTGTVTVFSDGDGAEPIHVPLDVAARSTQELSITDLHPAGTFASAMVEITGGGGFVEQRADHTDGSAVSPCSNSTSSTWYFADNYTLNGSLDDIVVTNPFPDPAIIDITFAGVGGTRAPQGTQGLAVPGHSVKVWSQEFMPKDESVLAVNVTASQGRVIAARAQQYQGERQGFTLSLGAPSASPQWNIADGESAGDVTFERYSIYNPNDVDVDVDAFVLGTSSTDFTPLKTITVPRGEVASLSMADFEGLPTGRHFLSFTTQSAEGVVVERGLTRRTDDGFITSVVLGAPEVFLGYYRWSMAISSTLAVDNVLAVSNLDGAAGTVTVKALGPGGFDPVPGLEAINVPAASVVTIAMPDNPNVLGHALVVECTQRIVVERLLPRGTGMRGRSGSLALPG